MYTIGGYKMHKIWDEFERIREEMNDLFSEFSSPFARRKNENGKFRKPFAEMHETDSEFVVNIELPGMKKEEIQLSSTDAGIEISAKHKSENKQENKEKGYFSYEKSFTGFFRHIPMPENANLESINASYKDGILTLKVPKLKIKTKKEIKIE